MKNSILFLSYSGGHATKVVFYKIKRNGSLTKVSEYDSGLNLFWGITVLRNRSCMHGIHNHSSF